MKSSESVGKKINVHINGRLYLFINSFIYLSVCLFIFVQTISTSLHHALVVVEFMLCLHTGRIERVAFISLHQTVCLLSQNKLRFY